MTHEEPSTTETAFATWFRGLGTDDRTRAELSKSVSYLCEDHLTPRSPLIRVSRREDLFRIGKLIDALKLNAEDPLQQQILDALLETVRTLAGLQPYDLDRESMHLAEVEEQESELKEEQRRTRDQLYDIFLNAHERQHQLSQLYPGTSKPGWVDAAQERLRSDEQWAHDLLADLRK